VTTSVDLNVFIALWQNDPALSLAAQVALDRARSRGTIVVSPPVYAELLAFPGRTRSFLDHFFHDTLVDIAWDFTERDWTEAGLAFQSIASRRRRQRTPHPRRILADFLIGAHANRRNHVLLTLDTASYQTAFPDLKILTF
jgi:predicted nucleic acid-binding protein